MINEDYIITEVCPHCETEITMQWSVEEFGYMAYCPVCGKRLMLCSACHDDSGFCDYDSNSDSCKFNRKAVDQKDDEPLTIDELKQMEGQPVWIIGSPYNFLDVRGMWDIIEKANEWGFYFSRSLDNFMLDNYNRRDKGGKLFINSWVAYRQEQEDKEK
jgi:hypothetical protein